MAASYVLLKHFLVLAVVNVSLLPFLLLHDPNENVMQAPTNKEKLESLTTENGGGKIKYCGYCPYNITTTCDKQLEDVMKSNPQLTMEAAQASLFPTCRFDPATEPYVVLHVGPHKTGTTSIQEFIYNSIVGKDKKPFFAEDNFTIPLSRELPGYYKDAGSPLNFAHCMIKNFKKDRGDMSAQWCNKIRSVLPKFMHKNYEAKRNILIVAEDFDRETIDHMRIQHYARPYKRIKVVATYRRLHEWLFSFYNQIIKAYARVYIANKTEFPSFVEWVGSEYDSITKQHTFAVMERYRNSGRFESIDVLNMHDGIELLENVFCNFLDTPATCRNVRDRKNVKIANKGQRQDYNRLCTKALIAGKIKKYSKRITRKVEASITKSNIKLPPPVCANETFLVRLLGTEMEQEKYYFPQWYAQSGEDELRKAFEESKPNFCSMDVDTILTTGVLDVVFEAYK